MISEMKVMTLSEPTSAASVSRPTWNHQHCHVSNPAPWRDFQVDYRTALGLRGLQSAQFAFQVGRTGMKITVLIMIWAFFWSG